MGAFCFKFPLPAGARLAQSVEHKALNLVVEGSSPTVGVAAELMQWLSAVNLRVPVLEPACPTKARKTFACVVPQNPQNFRGPEKFFSAILSSRAMAHTPDPNHNWTRRGIINSEFRFSEARYPI